MLVTPTLLTQVLWTIDFFGGGGGMKNNEKNCLQGLERQNKKNKLFAKTQYVQQNIVCISKKMFAEVHKLKKRFAKKHVSMPSSPPKKNSPFLSKINSYNWIFS